jgi:hypothetical protein
MKDHGMKQEDITPEIKEKVKRTYSHYLKNSLLLFYFYFKKENCCKLIKSSSFLSSSLKEQNY